jgi:cobalt-precorrin-5B (C1)-methyltransferase
VLISNFIGESLDICRELGFKGALLVGHIGKLVKSPEA